MSEIMTESMTESRSQCIPIECCVCSIKDFETAFRDMQRFNVEFMVSLAFDDFLHFIDANLDFFVFTTLTQNYRDLQYVEKEHIMKRAIVKLLKKFYDPNKEVMPDGGVKRVEDVCPILERELYRIRARFAAAADVPSLVVTGKASYHRFLLECLLVSAKFASRCMARLAYEREACGRIFDNVLALLKKWFEDENVFGEIRHASIEGHPFGL